MATTIFSSWFRDHIASFPRPEPDDEPLPQLGITFFVRAPHLEEDSTADGWASMETVEDLLADPHWQAPGYFEAGTLVTTTAAALAPYYVSESSDRFLVQLAEPFTITSPASTTATPIVAIASWYNGTMAGKERPLISLVRLDGPLLLMADVDHPATLSSLLFFAWSD